MFEFDIYNIKCRSNEIEVTRKVTISRIKQRQNKKAKKSGGLMVIRIYVDYISSSKYL